MGQAAGLLAAVVLPSLIDSAEFSLWATRFHQKFNRWPEAYEELDQFKLESSGEGLRLKCDKSTFLQTETGALEVDCIKITASGHTNHMTFQLGPIQSGN